MDPLHGSKALSTGWNFTADTTTRRPRETKWFPGLVLALCLSFGSTFGGMTSFDRSKFFSLFLNPLTFCQSPFPVGLLLLWHLRVLLHGLDVHRTRQDGHDCWLTSYNRGSFSSSCQPWLLPGCEPSHSNTSHPLSTPPARKTMEHQGPNLWGSVFPPIDLKGWTFSTLTSSLLLLDHQLMQPNPRLRATAKPISQCVVNTSPMNSGWQCWASNRRFWILSNSPSKLGTMQVLVDLSARKIHHPMGWIPWICAPSTSFSRKVTRLRNHSKVDDHWRKLSWTMPQVDLVMALQIHRPVHPW